MQFWQIGKSLPGCAETRVIYCRRRPPSSAADNFPLDVQHAEETFDLALVAALEIDVVPHLGDPRVPDYVISQLANMLQQGSQIRDDHYRPPSPASSGSMSRTPSVEIKNIDTFGQYAVVEGSTEPGRFLSRERFSYWCFDLLFLVCSDVPHGMC